MALRSIKTIFVHLKLSGGEGVSHAVPFCKIRDCEFLCLIVLVKISLNLKLFKISCYGYSN